MGCQSRRGLALLLPVKWHPNTFSMYTIYWKQTYTMYYPENSETYCRSVRYMWPRNPTFIGDLTFIRTLASNPARRLSVILPVFLPRSSVWLSVMLVLVNCGHIHWDSRKVISRFTSWVRLLQTCQMEQSCATSLHVQLFRMVRLVGATGI